MPKHRRTKPIVSLPFPKATEGDDRMRRVTPRTKAEMESNMRNLKKQVRPTHRRTKAFGSLEELKTPRRRHRTRHRTRHSKRHSKRHRTRHKKNKKI